MKKWYLPVILLFALVLAACSSVASTAETTTADETAMVESDDVMMDEKSDDAMMDDGDDEMMATDHTDDAMMDEKDDEAMADDMSEAMADGLPAWQTLSLTDARTGAAFTLADFAGKTVFVEPMATWCGNCRRQLTNVASARAELAGEDVAFIALSLETTLPDAELAGYADGAGFDWTFAVMSDEMLSALADAFGRSITSAPSTPHFIIRPDGSTTDLVTGIDAPAQLIDMIRAAQS